jgi:hypothetical protein
VFAKGVSWPVAGRIVLTLIPQALGLTIPMALLTGSSSASAGFERSRRRSRFSPAASARIVCCGPCS